MNKKIKTKYLYAEERKSAENFAKLLKPMDDETKLRILMLIEGYSAGLRYASKPLYNNDNKIPILTIF